MTLRIKPDPLLIRASIAMVWLYQGLWCAQSNTLLLRMRLLSLAHSQNRAPTPLQTGRH